MDDAPPGTDRDGDGEGAIDPRGVSRGPAAAGGGRAAGAAGGPGDALPEPGDVDAGDRDGDDGRDDADYEEDGDEAPRRRAPWHFKIILVGTVLYLAYRLYQGIGWLIHHA